ncbi:MAG: DNA-directed RNA polymerase subunit beta [Armatimonadetes bacterium]|nr:DNA-directed RNA polymerase subunit beta [Armatimonadota bacterium]
MAQTNGAQSTLNPRLDGLTRRRNEGPRIYRWEDVKDFVPVPNLVQLQVQSFEWFLTEGLRELFRSFSPVEDFTGNLSLEFLDSSLGDPKYSLQECREREVTYERPLRVRVMLVHKDTGEIRESEVYLGELPMMTPRGTFIINGAERVVVSQLSRSPGVYFKDNIDNAGRTLYSAQVIPSEGAWIEFDVGNTNVISVKIGQTRKFPVTTLLRAFHYFDEAEPRTQEAREVKAKKADDIIGHVLAERVVSMDTGEIVCEVGQTITAAIADLLMNSGNLTPIRIVDARLGCSTTKDLLRIFGSQIKLHRPPTLAQPVVSPRGGDPLDLPIGTPITATALVAIERFAKQHRVPPQRLMLTLAHGDGRIEEMDLRSLNRFVEHHPPLSREMLTGKRLVSDLLFAGEAAPVARAYERITGNIAELIVGQDLDELIVMKVDEAIEQTLEDDPVAERLEETPAENEKLVLESLYKILRPGDPASVESGRSLLRSMFFDPRRYDLARVGRYKINRKLHTELNLDVRYLTKFDLIAIIKYLVQLRNNADAFNVDDIDNLENKRVRAVGELLQNQLRLGFLRMERVARERMTSADPATATAQTIISIKPITAAIKSFFGSGALSQFMDQTNPLAELAHKRRVSSMGPGGLSRQSAKLEVRDVHRSHYGRLCPIMTPEGPNIGLISALAIFARLNEFGFLETPYRKVVDGRPTDELVWLTADQETEHLTGKKRPPTIAAANTWDDQQGVWVDTAGRTIAEVVCRRGHQFPRVRPEDVDLIDVSPKQIFSAATSLIPFLENDDANRALMGSNMQRQAVPLVRTASPWVATGIERRIAVDSGAVICAGRDGVVTRVDARHIVITGYDGSTETHHLLTFERTNQATFMNQMPIVQLGQHVRGPRSVDGEAIQVQPESQLPDGATAGDPIADGSCTDFGRLALGKNVTVAFMSWEGYNYEDAIILSERMVRDDVFTSIHIDKYEIQARDTKLGPEEITADIPNISDELRNQLDDRGIIKIGTVVQPEDILVGKVAPKGQSEMTAEEKLVIAIFGKKAEEMRDVSLRVPHGAKGKVVAVRVFSRYKHRCLNPQCGHLHEFSKSADLAVCELCGSREIRKEPGDELSAGVNQLVRVYIAQRRKIMEGDKMAGRHGNKGVISKILPIEDMPFLSDGRPIDVILNPLGVPSRMNIGQILETHLGYVAQHRGLRFETPVFASIPEERIFEWLGEVYDEKFAAVLSDYLATEVPYLDDELTGDPAACRARLTEATAALEEMDLLEHAGRFGLDTDALMEAEPAARVEAVVARIWANATARMGFKPHEGKMVLRDGRTGKMFDRDIMVGVMYVLKLSHLVDDKIHARSTGPYSLVTQQPLGGKAQFGGQRFGEMEVWALEAYGSAHSLQEVLTIKSDDVHGRVKAYEAIVKGENLQEPGIPESFKILIKELQSLGLEVTVESKEGRPVDLSEPEE